MGLAHRAWLVMLVREWIGGAGNLMMNDRTGSQVLACLFENGFEGQVI